MRFRLLGLDLCIGRHGPARDEDQCAGGAACAHNLGRHNLSAEAQGNWVTRLQAAGNDRE